MASRLGIVERNFWTEKGQTMITTVLFIVAGMFFLKIAWNILTPFVLAQRLLIADSGKSSGISMSPYIEICLWLLLMIISIFSGGSDWLHNPKKIAVWGIATIAGSYVILAVLGYVLGWFVSHLKKCRNNTSTSLRQ